MAEEPDWDGSRESTIVRRDTTIVRKLESGLVRDKNLARVRRMIETDGSSGGVVTMENLQKLLNDNDFCEILFNLFNEGRDEPLKQSLWFDKMKAWTEVDVLFSFGEILLHQCNVEGDTSNNAE